MLLYITSIWIKPGKLFADETYTDSVCSPGVGKPEATNPVHPVF